MKKFSLYLILLSLAFGVLIAPAAHAAIVYVTDCNNATAYILDTDTATFSSHAQSTAWGCAIAVSDRVVVSNYTDDGVVEYDLDFVPTGVTWPGNFTWTQMLDGTTDGSNNYVASWPGIGVVEMDLNFQGGVVLFDPGFDVIGITYDPTDDSLWLVNDDNSSIYHYSKAGDLLGSFDAALPGRDCCLSYDASNHSLWIGLNSQNTLYQFDKSGVLLDSVTFPGWAPSNQWGAEISLDVSIEVAIDIKFCSDPNAFNCKKNGVLPVTIFGTADFLVEDIDPSTLRLCTENMACTGAPRDYSYADRGNPLLDLGSKMCAIDPDTGEELDWTENRDDFVDLDAAFEASEVKAILGDFCDDAAKGDVSEALVIIGETYDGVPIYSVPADDNTGIDRLVNVNK